MAVNQLQNLLSLGFYPPTPGNGLGTQALNGALSAGFSGTWLAYGFLAPAGNKSITQVRAYLSGVTGTLGASDLQCDVMIDSGAQPGTPPGSSIGNSTTLSGGAPAGAGWIEWTGIVGASTTFGTPYWLMFRNANAAPTTNFPTFQFGSTDTGIGTAQGESYKWGGGKSLSSNSGSTWGTQANNICGWRIKFSDGTYMGMPVQNILAGTDKVFATGGTGILGVKFTTPPGAALNVVGVNFLSRATNTSSGNRLAAIYLDQGTGSLGTQQGSDANAINVVNVSATSAYFAQLFPAPIVLQPATSYRVVFKSSAGSSVSSYNCPSEYVLDSDANSVPGLMPFANEAGAGAMQKTYWNGSAWTDTPTSLIPMALLLDSTGEFTAAGGGRSNGPFIVYPANIPLF